MTLVFKLACLLLALAIAVESPVANAADPVVKVPPSTDSCSQLWVGLIDASTQEFEIRIDLEGSSPSGCIGTLAILEQGVTNSKINDFLIDKDDVSFSTRLSGSRVSFRGKLADNRQRIDGQVTGDQYAMPFKLAHESTALAKRPVSFRPIELHNVVGLPSDRASIARPEHPAIQYATTPTTDVVAELNRKLSDGSARLDFGTQGYLQSALDLLNIDISSQMVVFSKTSVQAHLISPNNPRALYFNDAVTLGYIRNAPFLELAAVDPKQGIVFYKLDQKDSATPQFVRDNVCLSCHLSRNTMDVPGLRLRSVVTGPTGRTFDYVGDFQMDQRTPFKEKWGGWYVTGSIKSATHLGNVLFVDAEKSESLNTAESVTLTTLTDRFDVKAYPAASSDVAALMVYEHQAHMTNLLVRIGWDTRVAIHQGLQNVDSELYMQFLANNAREAVDYMLFVDEPRLPGKVATSSTFAKEFSEKGPRDKKGRSLKQLDLATRLLRYPCSYLIYDPIFESLPVEAKAALYHRMWEILSGKVNDRKYEHLSHSDRRNIIDILRDTKSDLPEYFR